MFQAMLRKILNLGFILLLAAPAHADVKTKVYFIPGAGSSGDQIYIQNFPNWLGSNYFGKFQETLFEEGIDNAVCPETQDQDSRTVEERAEECVQVILRDRPQSVILVGHSMGGLVARVVAHDPRLGSVVKTVLTLSTPHLGTPIADVAIDSYKNPFNFYGWCANFAGFTPEHTRYLPELRTDRSKNELSTFSAQDTPDNPNVKYYSFSASFDFRATDPLEISHNLIWGELGRRGLDQTDFGAKNDGIVSEYSMVYGTYLGHIDASHFETACVDPFKDSDGCRATLKVLVPFLKSQLGQN